MTDPMTLPCTGEIAAKFGLTEAQVSGILRRRSEIKPPIVNHRRRWRPQDVEALRTYLRARAGQRKAT